VTEFGRFRDCSSGRVENELKTIYFRLGKVQSFECMSDVVIMCAECVVKSVPYSEEITGGLETRFRN